MQSAFSLTTEHQCVPTCPRTELYEDLREKKKKKKLHLDWKREMTHIWTGKCEEQMNIIQLFWSQRGIWTPGLKCLWGLVRIVRPTDTVHCVSSIHQCHQPMCRQLLQGFHSQDSTRPNRWFKSSAVFLTVKFSAHCPPWKQHLSSCRRTGLWRRVRGSLLEWKGICGMIFCSRHQ